MFLPGCGNVGAGLKPGEATALHISIDTGISFGEDNLQFSIAVQVASNDKGSDIVGIGKSVSCPALLSMFVPVGTSDNLVLSIAVEIRDIQSLFGLGSALRIHPIFTCRDHLNLRPGANVWILRERHAVQCAVSLIPSDERRALIGSYDAHALIVILVVPRAHNDMACP